MHSRTSSRLPAVALPGACVHFLNQLSPRGVTSSDLVTVRCPAEGSHLWFALVHSCPHLFFIFFPSIITAQNSFFGFSLTGRCTDCHEKACASAPHGLCHKYVLGRSREVCSPCERTRQASLLGLFPYLS